MEETRGGNIRSVSILQFLRSYLPGIPASEFLTTLLKYTRPGLGFPSSPAALHFSCFPRCFLKRDCRGSCKKLDGCSFFSETERRDAPAILYSYSFYKVPLPASLVVYAYVVVKFLNRPATSHGSRFPPWKIQRNEIFSLWPGSN